MPQQQSLGIYIHYPYCRTKCNFCDFNAYRLPKESVVNSYCEALLKEIDHWAGTLSAFRPLIIETLYFGGGTPSLISIEYLTRVLKALNQFGEIAGDCEITIESTPGSLSPSLLRNYRALGINRLSIGAESFDPKMLKALERDHGVEDIFRAIEWAERAGFDNLCLDLMYGLPHQTMDDLGRDLAQLIACSARHLSIYQLTLTSRHPLTPKLPKEEDLVAMFYAIHQALEANGFVHYEISNYAKSGFECRHNRRYWGDEDFLGLGAGAHSYFMRYQDAIGGAGWGVRWANIMNPLLYTESLKEGGRPTCRLHALTESEAFLERIMTGLRLLKEGVNVSKLSSKFNNLTSNLESAIAELRARRWVDFQGGVLKLSPEGFCFADEAALKLTEK
ncbi:MAG: radical SAM family heme chaperone HemW [Deltaproteobacteria bacterium]|nr:radical SAM family heme chaperone HemW [Deltaproteobacteria bacterium]